MAKLTTSKAWGVIRRYLPDLEAFRLTRREYRRGLSLRQHNPRVVAIEVAHAPTGDIPALTAALADLFRREGYATKYPVTPGPEGGALLVAVQEATA